MLAGCSFGRLRMGRRALLPVLLGVLFPSAGAGIEVVGAGGWYESASWDLGLGTVDSLGRDGKPTQQSLGAYADLVLGAGLGAHLELAGSATGEGPVSLDLGDHSALGMLLHYQPAGASWRLQAGLRSGTGRALKEGGRALAQRLAEPILAAREPELAHGARFHLGVVAGHPAARGWDLLAGAGYEQHAGFEPSSGGTIRGGSVLSGLVGTTLRKANTELGVHLQIEWAGALEFEGVTIRDAHRRSALRGWFAHRLESLRLELTAGRESSGDLQWPAAQEYGRTLQAGPGIMMSSGIVLGAYEGWVLGKTWNLIPALAYRHRRLSPDGLPHGEGWSAQMGPRLTLQGPRQRFEIAMAWTNGHWRPYEAERSGWRKISGAHLTLAVATRFAARSQDVR